MYLKVGPKKSSLKLGIYPKLTLRFCGSFEILARIGLVTYALKFPTCIKVKNVFHVSLLENYAADPNHVIYWYLI